MSENWKERLNSKRLIFTVSAGRSGTHFLTRLFRYLPGMDVFHENNTPHFHDHMRAAQEDPNHARKFLNDEKLPFIESLKKPIYAETSHLFCKGFLEPLLELGVVPDLVLLSRDRRKIATSLFRLGTIPARQEKALQFYLKPDDPGVVTMEDWNSWSDYQLCYWYVLEIERRQRVYGQKVRELGGCVHACDLDEINTAEGYRELIKALNLRGPNPINWLKFYKNRQRKAGNFDASKSQRKLPKNQLAEEAEVESLFEIA